MPAISDDPWRGKRWDLPPLILHPFGGGSEQLASFDSVKLSLHLAGIGDPGWEKERLLRARYGEFRMVCLAGKDVMRWIAQCTDFAAREEALANAGIQPQSFADLAVNRTPAGVAARFETWGVMDHRRILARAIGINAVFPNPPAWGTISSHFLDEYYAYADHLFACYQG